MRRVSVYRVVALSLATMVFSGCSYKKFTAREEAVKAEWTQVQSELQLRNDLVPVLLDMVKTYAPGEQSVLRAVTDSHNRLAGARTHEDTIAAANEQWTALQRLHIAVNEYPELKASDAFKRLMDDLADTEQRIAVERMRYNAQVQLYRTSQRSLTGMLTALATNADDYPFFLVPTRVGEVPRVDAKQQP